MKLIDADALPINSVGIVDAEGNYYGVAEVVFKEDVEDAQTVDPVRHSRWIVDSRGNVICEWCGQPNLETYYCPFCGSKMDGEEHEAS